MEASRSEQDYTDLIAKLREDVAGGEYSGGGYRYVEVLPDTAVAAIVAIQALVEERDELKREMHARELHHFEEEQKSAGLAAVLEALIENSERLTNSRNDEWVEIDASSWDRYLNGTADALGEHDRLVAERAWDEAGEEFGYALQTPPDGMNQSDYRKAVISTLIERGNPYRKEQESADV